MNLILRCMYEISQVKKAVYEEVQAKLPLLLLERALKNKSISSYYVPRLKLVRDWLNAYNAKLQLWKNTEIYHPIDCLSRAQHERYLEYFVSLLELHLGMRPLSDLYRFPDQYYRLSHSYHAVYRVRSKKISKVRHPLLSIAGFSPRVYRPLNGLFNDLLDENQYPMMHRYDAVKLRQKLLDSLHLLKKYSRDIYDDFQKAIYDLVLLTNTPHVGTRSLTKRYQYYGGIFINLFLNDRYTFVEGLIHEYYHTRCWLWWEVTRPTGIPSWDATITSPTSKRKVKADQMIHALMIYVGVIHFYRWCLENPKDHSTAGLKSALQRSLYLESIVPELGNRLKAVVKKKTNISLLMDLMMEIFEAIDISGKSVFPN